MESDLLEREVSKADDTVGETRREGMKPDSRTLSQKHS